MLSFKQYHLMKSSLGAFALFVGLSTAFMSSLKAQAIENPLLIEEVHVYAQKREQSLSDVPIAITVLTGEQLADAKVFEIRDLTTISPSFSFDTAQGFQNSSMKIRGIGTFGNGRTFEGAVGLFVDDVYRSRSGMALTDLLDVEQIEILRGPQSTLFGKNTSAGSINVHSKRPQLGIQSIELATDIGNYDLLLLRSIINLPIQENSAFRLAMSSHKRDGFFSSADNDDRYNEVDRYTVKPQWLYRPSDELEILVIADYSKSDANCCWGSAQVVNGPTAPLVDLYSSLRGLTFESAPIPEKHRRTSLNSSPNEKVEDKGIQLKAVWTQEDWTLTSISSIRQWDNEQSDADTDYVPADLFRLFDESEIDTASQEFNALWQPNDQLQLLTGIYLAKEDYSGSRILEGAGDADNFLISLLNPTFTPAPCLPPLDVSGCLIPTGIGALLPDGELTHEKYNQDSESYAIYSHLTWDIDNDFQIVGGLRYSVEDKSGGVDILYWYNSPIAPFLSVVAGFPNDGTPRNGLDVIGVEYSPPFEDSIKDEELTGSLALNYNLNNDLLIYTSYSRGFKAGGVNLFREAILTDTTTYDPEYADSYEIGLKSQYWQGRASSNLALFYTEFSDLQINFFDGLNFRTENTGKARTQGAELESTIVISEQWGIDFAVTYLEATFESLDNPQLSYLLDRETPRAPNWASVLGVNYSQDVSANLAVKARASLSYMGEHYVGADVIDEEKQDEYLITDLSISLQNPNESWGVTLWCKNCESKDYRTIYFNSAFQAGSYNAYLNAPRQYGATLKMRF